MNPWFEIWGYLPNKIPCIIKFKEVKCIFEFNIDKSFSRLNSNNIIKNMWLSFILIFRLFILIFKWLEVNL